MEYARQGNAYQMRIKKMFEIIHTIAAIIILFWWAYAIYKSIE